MLFVVAHLASLSLAAEVGDKAPSFVLSDLDGEVVRAEAGRPMVVNFWASWCAPCREELPLIDALNRELGGQALVVAVNVDASQRNPAVVAGKLGLTLPVLRDDGSVVSLFDPPALPSTYVVAPDGHIAAVHTGALDAKGVAALGAQVRGLVQD